VNQKKDEKIPLSQMDIDQLAMKHLGRHINDESDRYLFRMYRRWGRAATWHAIKRAEETIAMMGLEPNDIRPGYVKPELTPFQRIIRDFGNPCSEIILDKWSSIK
jgi:hypothetical protein|tara:strand:- start:31628 stop:31942 length:315 start_codon:yes stop_codon:yes gene_type:complete